MNTDEKAYELHIFKKVIDAYLDESVPVTEEGLNSLLSKRDQMVWEISQKVYSQSGHKVGFSTVRNVIDSRIEVLKKHIANVKAEESRRLAKAKAEESRRLAKEAQQRVEAENRRQSRLIELARKLDESDRDKNIFDLFLKVQDVVSKQLEVALDEVTLDSHITNDLGADELVMALE